MGGLPCETFWTIIEEDLRRTKKWTREQENKALHPGDEVDRLHVSR